MLVTISSGVIAASAGTASMAAAEVKRVRRETMVAVFGGVWWECWDGWLSCVSVVVVVIDVAVGGC